MDKRVMVIFDYDGTLLDSIHKLYAGVIEVFRRSKMPIPEFVDFVRELSSPYTDFYKNRGVNASSEQIWEWYLSASDKIQANLFPDSYHVLKQLRNMGVILSIVSGQKTEHITMNPEFQDVISRFFFSVVGGVEGKVEAIHQTSLAYQMNNRHRVFYVGDFAMDMRDAVSAGVLAVGITRGMNTRDCLIEAGATFCIDSLAELIPIIKATHPSAYSPVGD